MLLKFILVATAAVSAGCSANIRVLLATGDSGTSSAPGEEAAATSDSQVDTAQQAPSPEHPSSPPEVVPPSDKKSEIPAAPGPTAVPEETFEFTLQLAGAAADLLIDSSEFYSANAAGAIVVVTVPPNVIVSFSDIKGESEYANNFCQDLSDYPHSTSPTVSGLPSVDGGYFVCVRAADGQGRTQTKASEIFQKKSEGSLFLVDTNAMRINSHKPFAAETVPVLQGIGQMRGIALHQGLGKIYATDQTNAKIWRMNFDGTSAEVLLSGLKGPEGIRVDEANGHVYFAQNDSTASKISRMNVDGTGLIDLVTGLDQARDVALNLSEGKMYYTERGTYRITRANLDGSSPVVISATPGAGIDVDPVAGRVYWNNPVAERVVRANLDGTGQTNISSTYMDNYGISLDLDNSRMFVSDYTSMKIWRLNIDGTGKTEIADLSPNKPYFVIYNKLSDRLLIANNLNGIVALNPADNSTSPIFSSPFIQTRSTAYDAGSGKVFWLDRSAGKIGRSTPDGSSWEIVLANGWSGGWEMAVDSGAGKIFWGRTTPAPAALVTSGLDGSNPTVVVSSGVAKPYGIALDTAGSRIFYTEFDAKEIRRVNYDGSGMQVLLTVTGANLYSLAYDSASDTLFYSDIVGRTIGKCSGSGADNTIIVSDIDPRTVFFDPVSKMLYYSDSAQKAVFRVNADGSGQTKVIDAPGVPWGLFLYR